MSKIQDHSGSNLRRVQKRNPPPSKLQQLRGVLLSEWDAIPQECVQKLIKSMLRREKALVKIKGSHIRY